MLKRGQVKPPKKSTFLPHNCMCYFLLEICWKLIKPKVKVREV